MQTRLFPFYFITGGCRSGKSRLALLLAEHLAATGLFIATAWKNDQEMQERITKHQQERGSHWNTLEAAHGLVLAEKGLPAVQHALRSEDVILLDCLSLWVASYMEAVRTQTEMEQAAASLMSSLWGLQHPVIVVSCETGLGIVPTSPLSRKFRDFIGAVNQVAAKTAQHAILCVSGLPLLLKGSLPPTFTYE